MDYTDDLPKSQSPLGSGFPTWPEHENFVQFFFHLKLQGGERRLASWKAIDLRPSVALVKGQISKKF